MISVKKDKLKSALLNHKAEMFTIIECKKDVLKLCLEYINKKSKKEQQEFQIKLNKISGDKGIKETSINWFLKSSRKKGDKHKIKSLKDHSNFFVSKNRKYRARQALVNEIGACLKYFNDSRIETLLTAKPRQLLQEQENFWTRFSGKRSKQVDTAFKDLLSYIFDYKNFSEKYKTRYCAYDYTRQLEVSSCLYCNRNYIITVDVNDIDSVRPELDHFFPQHKNPLLTLSFYNLIPSCHTCNSNLKNRTDFNLDEFFHPFLKSFDDLGVKFTYSPLNPKAFFKSDGDLTVKLDISSLTSFQSQVEGNISTFKLNEIYHHHEDLIQQLQEIKRKSNNNFFDWLRTDLFVDAAGDSLFKNKQEVYELVMMNFYEPENYHKRPMAKFLKDMAVELTLIK